MPELTDNCEEVLWLKKASLAASILQWRRDAQLAIDQLMARMFASNSPLGARQVPFTYTQEFKTPKGRPCLLALAVGDEATTFLKRFTAGDKSE